MSDEIKFAASDSGARGWQKVLKRHPNNSFQKPTEVGWLRPGDSRVNMLGGLDTVDKENVYKVKVLSEGKFSIVGRGDADLRIQVFDANRRVIMDSKPKMGLASKNFEAMAHDEFSLKSGDYFVKISRGDKVPQSQKVNFALQMVVGDGTYKNDYLTREVTPSKQDRINAVLQPESNNPASTASGFLSDFAGTGTGGLMNPPQLGRVLSVLT